MNKEKALAAVASSPFLWVEGYEIKTEQGKRLDFYDHLFMIDIFNDLSPKQVCYKAAQIGFSTTAILKTFWVAKYMGMDIIYTLPTVSDSRDFVGSKINRLVAQNPILQQMVKDKDTMDQKQVGNNIIHYRGTWTEKGAMMIPSDLNVYDEVDASKQEIISQYSTRLQHSEHGWEWYFSHPSVPGNGVSLHWEKSDQKHWFITCGQCKHRQFLSWPDSIDIEKEIYVCKDCGQELTDEDRRVGKWVAKYPKREWSGYWINLLMCTWVSAAKICEYYREKSQEYFWNKVLGLPYVGEGNTVTPDMIHQCISQAQYDLDSVVIGCDSGIKKHYVVGNANGIFYYGETEDWGEIEKLLRMYDRSVLVVDALPDITGPRALREKYPGRVFLCHYIKDRKTMQLVRWGTKDKTGDVLVDRNRMIQLVIDEMYQRRFRFYGDAKDYEQYIKHWLNIYKVKERNSLGVEEFKWERSHPDDHWVHSTVYWRAGIDRFGKGKVEFVGGKSTDIPAHKGVIIQPEGFLNN